MAEDREHVDDISEETRVMATQVRLRAAHALLGAGLAGLAADALATPQRDMSAGEIRDLAATAMEQAQQVSYLLGKLAGLEDGGEQ
jgi:hypothetical protein